MKTSQISPLSYICKIFSISILTMFLCKSVTAQSIEPASLSKINLYADFGGHIAGHATINIEGQIYSGEKLTWYARGGVGGAGVLMAVGGPGISGAVTMLTGKGNRHFEINGGAFVGKDLEQNNVFAFPLLDFGYRYQKPTGGFIFMAKAGILGVGIGFGYAF